MLGCLKLYEFAQTPSNRPDMRLTRLVNASMSDISMASPTGQWQRLGRLADIGSSPTFTPRRNMRHGGCHVVVKLQGFARQTNQVIEKVVSPAGFEPATY